MENETSMQEDAEQALSLEDSKRLLRHVYRVRENRRRILDRVPFLLRWGKWRKKKERQILADWTGGYVLINDRDYLYLPAGMDTMSTHYLIRRAESEPTVKNFCPPGGTVIDIGCNYGEWALQMARAVGRSGKVYAFEPVQRLADCAQKTMDVNGLGQTEIVTSAVSNRDSAIAAPATRPRKSPSPRSHWTLSSGTATSTAWIFSGSTWKATKPTCWKAPGKPSGI